MLTKRPFLAPKKSYKEKRKKQVKAGFTVRVRKKNSLHDYKGRKRIRMEMTGEM